MFGKLAAKCSRSAAGRLKKGGVTFKVTDIAYEMLRDQPGLRPTPYLASRGMKWIQHYAKPGLSDADLKDYLRQSHRIVSLGLSKKKQRELEISWSYRRILN